MPTSKRGGDARSFFKYHLSLPLALHVLLAPPHSSSTLVARHPYALAPRPRPSPSSRSFPRPKGGTGEEEEGEEEEEEEEEDEDDDDKAFWKCLGFCCGAFWGPLSGFGSGIMGSWGPFGGSWGPLEFGV